MRTNILSFLNKDIAEKFEANFKTQYKTKNFSRFIVEYGSGEEVISLAFVWSRTPEGFDFWNTVNDLWRKFLKEGREPIPENQDMEILALECRFNNYLEKVKLSPESILDEFRSLFGEKVFEVFKSNVEYYPSVEDTVRFLIDTRSVSNLVDLSFSWIDTPEGYKYWAKISDMWKVYWETKTGMRSVK